MVVIIKIDNNSLRYCYVANDVESAKDFISKEVGYTIEEMSDFEETANSPNCKVYDFDDVVYRIHLKPEKV